MDRSKQQSTVGGSKSPYGLRGATRKDYLQMIKGYNEPKNGVKKIKAKGKRGQKCKNESLKAGVIDMGEQFYQDYERAKNSIIELTQELKELDESMTISEEDISGKDFVQMNTDIPSQPGDDAHHPKHDSLLQSEDILQPSTIEMKTTEYSQYSGFQQFGSSSFQNQNIANDQFTPDPAAYIELNTAKIPTKCHKKVSPDKDVRESENVFTSLKKLMAEYSSSQENDVELPPARCHLCKRYNYTNKGYCNRREIFYPYYDHSYFGFSNQHIYHGNNHDYLFGRAKEPENTFLSYTIDVSSPSTQSFPEQIQFEYEKEFGAMKTTKSRKRKIGQNNYYPYNLDYANIKLRIR